MKYLGLIVLCLSVFGSFAEAAPRPTTFANLTKWSVDFAQSLQNSTGCSFTARKEGAALKLTMRNTSEGWLQFTVLPSHTITLEHPRVYHDGSYDKIFRVVGQGTLRLVHADDAFLHAYLSNGSKTISCEVDF
jgi:hypothetical protein